MTTHWLQMSLPRMRRHLWPAMKDEAWWPWFEPSEDPFTREWTADWQEQFDLMSDAEQGHVERNWEQCVLLPFYRARKRRLA